MERPSEAEGKHLEKKTQQSKAIYLIVTEQRSIGILPAKKVNCHQSGFMSLCGNFFFLFFVGIKYIK